MFGCLTLIAAALVFLVGLYWRLTNTRAYQLCKKLPGPKPKWIIGNLDMLWKHSKNMPITEAVVKYMEDIYNQYYDEGLVRLFVGPRPIVYLYRQRTINKLLASRTIIDKPLEYRLLDEWLGGGLLTSSGDPWRQKRRLLTPAFHSKVIEDFIPLINKHARIYCDVLSQQPDDLLECSMACALDVILESSMGYEENVQTKGETPYLKALKRYNILYIIRSTKPWLTNDWIYYNLTSDGREAWRHLQIMKEHTQAVLTARKEQMLRDLHCDLYTIEKQKFEPLINILLRCHLVDKTLDEKQVLNELSTFTFAGFDTSALAMTYCLFNLAQNAEIQARLYNEIVDVAGPDLNKDIELEDLKRMPYLDAVLKESLRLYPSVPAIIRESCEDIEIDGQLIPAGISIAMVLFLSQRDEAEWPNANQFDPDRFMSTDGNKNPAYYPFSSGSRSCIGKQFATNEVKIVVANVVRRYLLEPITRVEDLRFAVEIVYKPKVPILVKFTERQ